jgi:hypothetical protein
MSPSIWSFGRDEVGPTVAGWIQYGTKLTLSGSWQKLARRYLTRTFGREGYCFLDMGFWILWFLGFRHCEPFGATILVQLGTEIIPSEKKLQNE